MRVLVTGAAGFIGGAVCDRLVAQGDDVVRLDALIPQAHGQDVEVDAGLHRLDLRRPDGLVDLLEGVDAVCHQAAMVATANSAVSWSVPTVTHPASADTS